MLELNQCMIDWVTLTQWADEGEWLYELADDIRGCGEVESARVMQYAGWSFGSVFFGTAEQSGRMHNMLRVSGAAAHDLIGGLGNVPGSVKCTRVDVQVTVPLDRGYDSGRFYVFATEGKDWKGRKRKVSRIQNEDGLDTVYIGSRQSEVFARLYVKEVGRPVVRALRFEVELKGGKSDVYKRALLSGKADMVGLLLWEWEKMPALAIAQAPSVGAVLNGGEPYRLRGVKTIREPSATYKWFDRSVVPALRRLLNDHDYGDVVRRKLEALLREV